MLNESFDGVQYRLADNWFDHVPVHAFKHRPINYIEVGTFYGANLLSVAKSYASHPSSKLYCIDPWEDYDDYPEYANEQDKIYKTFLGNIERSEDKHKIVIDRGYSHKQLPKYDDNFFDIIYIDGNHEPEYVLEDAVLAFRKLKVGGYLIFDDYGWGGPDLTKRGIDGFMNGYHKRIKVLGERYSQMFIQKTK